MQQEFAKAVPTAPPDHPATDRLSHCTWVPRRRRILPGLPAIRLRVAPIEVDDTRSYDRDSNSH